jgi:hypothetical protein
LLGIGIGTGIDIGNVVDLANLDPVNTDPTPTRTRPDPEHNSIRNL